MARGFAIASTAIVTGVLVSAFWVFAYNIRSAPTGPDGTVASSGDITTLDPRGGP